MESPQNNRPLKSEAPFQEMILENNPEKSETVINTCDCFTHKRRLEKDDRYSTKTWFLDLKHS